MAASAGSWSAPSLLYWEKPDGSIVAVDEYGAPLDSPPQLKEVSAESLGYDPSVGQLVVDQWGRVVVPYYPPGSYGVADDGSDAAESFNPAKVDWRETSWPPSSWPPGATGLPASYPTTEFEYDYAPDEYHYWTDPSTGKPVLVDELGKPVSTPPDIQEIDGKVIDPWGNEIEPLWPESAPTIGPDGTPLEAVQMASILENPIYTNQFHHWWAGLETTRYWKDPTTGDLVVVDSDGMPMDSPPALVEVDGKVYDPWGNRLDSYWPEANLGVAEDGTPLPGSTMPGGFTPPAMRHWTDPSTGDLVAVDPDGTPIPSPPALLEVDGKVVDQWGNEVKSYWPEPNLGLAEDGTPLPGSTMPDGFTPPAMHHWTDPSTGELVAVDLDGTPIPSPPALLVVDGKIVDQWGNEVKPYWPEGNFGIAEDGTLQGGNITPDGFEPSATRFWQDPSTGQIVAVDESGTPLTTPPALTEVTGELRDALGFPPGQYQAVVDPWGNPIMPLNPPGSFGVDAEGQPLEGGGWVPEWPPEVWPPASDTDETVDFDDEVELPDEVSAVPPDDLEASDNPSTSTEPDPNAAPPDDTVTADPDDVRAADLDAAAEPEPKGSPRNDAEAPTADEVALDDLVTAGLDEPLTAESVVTDEAPEAAANDIATPVEEIEGLMTAGLEPEFKVEAAEFEVEEDSGLPVPIPTPIPPASEIEPIELPDLAEIPPVEPVEEVTIEPIEILVEPLDTAPVREVTAIDESDERDLLADDDDEEEEQEVQP